MNARSQPSTKGAERAPRSKTKRPADAATSNGAVTKPGKGSSAELTPAPATLHPNGGGTPVERVLALLGDSDREGDGFIAHCPAHEDSNPSLRITEGDDGRALLTCRASCKVDRIVAKLGITMADLFPVEATKRKVTKQRAPRVRKRASKPRKVKELTPEVRAEAMRQAKRLFPTSRFAGYKLTAVYPYRRADGSVWCWRWRFEHATRDKEIGPFHYNGAEWVAKEPRPPRAGKPLYRLPELIANEGPVFIVEGEKCADALAALGIVATTSGSSSTAKGADWSPLAKRECRIWPDNDDAGDRYAADAAARLRDQGTEVRLVDVQSLDLPNKGDDAADWLAANRKATADDVLSVPLIDAPDDDFAVQLVCAADVAPRAVQWLWKGWLARGMLHILAGDGGTGKTTVMLSIAAAITTGGRLPDGTTAQAGNVLIWSGEDDIERVLIPRLQEAGADLSRAFFVRGVIDDEGARPFDPSTDMPMLEWQAEKVGNVALVLVDPIVNAVSGDSHKNAEVRRGLQPLVDLGFRLQAAVVGISHFAKNTEGHKTTSRIIGSVAYSNLARLAMASVKSRSGECRVVRCKSNIGPDGDGFGYSIDIVQREYDGEQNDVSRIVWRKEPLKGYASELLDQVEATKLRMDEAADWLNTRLADGPVAQKDIAAQAKDDGIAWRTVERAKDGLGVVAYPEGKKGKRGNGRWMWSLPPSRGVAERRAGGR